MKPADIHSLLMRVLNETIEDESGMSNHDLLIMVSGKLAMELGIPPTQATHSTPRFTARQLRSILWPILDDKLEGAAALELMTEIDRALSPVGMKT